jgi:diguanylate cyclase (GGDEF)-like protein
MSLAVALAAALLAAAAITYMARARAEVDAALARAAALEGEAAERARLAARVRALQREVETLSAIREVALIANDDVSFERILAEVLRVVEELLGARALAIALADETGGAPAVRARRAGGSVLFAPRGGAPGAALSASGRIVAAPGDLALAADLAADEALVHEAYRAKRTLVRRDARELSVATLLYADAEVGGVLLARVPLAQRAEEEVASAAPALEALAKHVALAVKKPTLYDRAVVDSLTRLFTKRHFTSQLGRACALARRSGRPFALVLADIDHFKRVNDTHGHLTGDIVLAEVAGALARTVRETDAAFRYGGEEMAVLAPEANLEAARALAERLRAAVEALPLRTAGGAPLRVTSSFGVAAFGPGADAPASLVAAADAALYAAKAAGRNRVRAAGEAGAAPAGDPDAAAPGAHAAPSPPRAERRARRGTAPAA